MDSSASQKKSKSSSQILNGFVLKLIALIAMTIDHIAIVLQKLGESNDILQPDNTMISDSTYEVMRIIGRCAFPIFCFMIVEGFCYTKSLTKYILRLAIFSIISQVPYNLGLRDKVFVHTDLNIFFTLTFGLCTIAFIRFCINKLRNHPENSMLFYAASIVGLSLAMYLADTLYMSYGSYGIILICIFYFTRVPDKDFYDEGRAIKYICLQLLAVIIATLIFQSGIQIYCAIAFVFIIMYNRKKGPNLKYLFYMYYPIHLLILYSLYFIIK